MTDLTKPIRLKTARSWRTYMGGRLIDELHQLENPSDTHFPEEWLMSTVRARNSGREDIVEGLSFTSEGNIPLFDIAGDLGVLVKLIDSAERLTVQVHPTKEKAAKLFSSDYGKTECWHILGTRKIDGVVPCIYLGFREGITREKWVRLFEEQDTEGMLECLHKIEVEAGDTFLIMGGVPHAIGHGCFLTEIQEPTDYTIRTERVTPAGLRVADFMCHQGLGFDLMFDCFEYTGESIEEINRKYRLNHRERAFAGYKKRTLVDYTDTPMFKMELIEVTDTYPVGKENCCRGMFVLSGGGRISTTTVKAGDQFFMMPDCEEFEVCGSMKLLKYYGPEKKNQGAG
jgi:mannose-6-phosphate isomerase